MNGSRALYVGGLACSALLATALSAGSLLRSGEGGSLLGRWFEQMRRHEQLASDHEVLHASWQRIQDIVTELVEGRLSLREGAARLRAEHESRPEHLRPDIRMFTCDSLEECYMQSMYSLADTRLVNSPHRTKVLARLEKELQAFLKAHPSGTRSREGTGVQKGPGGGPRPGDGVVNGPIPSQS
jgi:hypothetical protein